MEPTALSGRRGQGPRSRRRAIRSLEKNVAEHQEKIRRQPDDPAVPHWEHEIREWQDQIRNHKRVLGHD